MVVPPPTLPIRSSANIWYDGGVIGMVVPYHHITLLSLRTTDVQTEQQPPVVNTRYGGMYEPYHTKILCNIM